MATRINVTAVRDCPSGEVRAVMSEVLRPARAGVECGPVGDQLEIHENQGWTWFTTSVWGISAADLNRALCRLARPALQFSTSDGERWYLTVHGGPGGQAHFLHEFAYHSHDPDPAEDFERQVDVEQRPEPPPVDPRLAFLEDDLPPSSDQPKVPFDLIAENLAGLGNQIPVEFRETVSALPYSQAAARYRRWHAEQVLAALSAAGIPHDPRVVRSVLLWETVTGVERDSDLGNLPRLLSVLGLGGEWDEWVRQVEAPPPPPELTCPVPAAPPPPSPDLIRPVLALVEPLGLTPVAGGPLVFPLRELGLCRFFPEALSIYDTAGVTLTVTLPPDFHRAVPPPSEHGGAQVEMTAAGFRVGLPNHLWLRRDDLKRLLGKALSRLLFHLPNGAVLDLAFALEGKPALMQRYRGPVAGKNWEISETYPALSRDALAGGMDLARYGAQDHEKHEARDEAEAAAIVELAKRDPTMWDMKMQRKGRMVWCESDVVGHLPKAFFRYRFATSWNVAGHDREAARLHQERLDQQRKMRQVGVEAARRRAAPHDDEILLQTKRSRYWRSDFARLTELEQETGEKFDATLAGLGFRHLGDLVAKKQRDVVLRTYVSKNRLSYAILMAKRTMYLGNEFFSRFTEGSTLTTTTNASVGSQPVVKVYYKIHSALEPAALYDKHLWGIERFRTRKETEPVPLDPTLLGLARELDQALARREGVGQRIRVVSVPPGEAPPDIRAAWVGCELPLFATSDDPRIGRKRKGVLSRQEKAHHEGWVVQVTDAVDALEHYNPKAARWWRDNTPDLLQPGKLFLFPAEACVLVEEADPPK
jgi:hypothetical protein